MCEWVRSRPTPQKPRFNRGFCILCILFMWFTVCHWIDIILGRRLMFKGGLLSIGSTAMLLPLLQLQKTGRLPFCLGCTEKCILFRVSSKSFYKFYWSIHGRAYSGYHNLNLHLLFSFYLQILWLKEMLQKLNIVRTYSLTFLLWLVNSNLCNTLSV